MIELSDLAVIEHLSELATKPVMGRADISLSGFGRAVLTLVF